MKTEQINEVAFLRPAAAAEYIGISRRFLATLTAKGALPAARIGRKCTLFARADLDQFVLSRMSGRVKK